MCRIGNEAANYLANWGCRNVGRQLDVTPSARIWNVELHPLQIIVDHDLDIDPRSGCLLLSATRQVAGGLTDQTTVHA